MQNTNTRENFSALLSRINSAKTPEELDAHETQAERHYNNDTITARQLMRLDVRAMERRYELES